jgi:hypothetical protein
VADAVGADDLAGFDFSVLYFVNLEGFGMTEVLEDISVLVCYCYSHDELNVLPKVNIWYYRSNEAFGACFGIPILDFLASSCRFTEVIELLLPASVFLFLISLPQAAGLPK